MRGRCCGRSRPKRPPEAALCRGPGSSPTAASRNSRRWPDAARCSGWTRCNPMSDNPFHAEDWKPVDGFAELTDITYHRHVADPTVRVAFNRTEVRNAFRPTTVDG